MNSQNTKIVAFLEEFRRQVMWEEKKSPNTYLSSFYIDGVSKIAMAGLASQMPDTQLHVLSCKSKEGKHLASEWVISHAGQLFSTEGPTSHEVVHEELFQQAQHKNPSAASDSHVTGQVKDPTPLLHMLTHNSEVMQGLMRKFEQVWAIKISAVQLDEQTIPASVAMTQPKKRI